MSDATAQAIENLELRIRELEFRNRDLEDMVRKAERKLKDSEYELKKLRTKESKRTQKGLRTASDADS